MKCPFLIGTKIYLRPLDRSDAPVIVPWVNDQDVLRTLMLYRPVTLHAEEEFIEESARDERQLVLGIALRQSDQLIGATGLNQIDFKDSHANFGIFIGMKSEWGKGYGTEATYLIVDFAFKTLNLNRVSLRVYEYNQRGIRVYEKLGFKREGILRQEHYHDGRRWDTLIMAVLREEWETLHK